MESTHYEILFVGLIFRKNEDGEPRACGCRTFKMSPTMPSTGEFVAVPRTRRARAAKKTLRRAVQAIG